MVLGDRGERKFKKDRAGDKKKGTVRSKEGETERKVRINNYDLLSIALQCALQTLSQFSKESSEVVLGVPLFYWSRYRSHTLKRKKNGI